MNKQRLDELYHELRMLAMTDDIIQKEAVAGITSHLTQPRGDYPGLLRFLSYYGENYILPDVIRLLYSTTPPLKFTRIVELGAGYGWLGRGISNAYDRMPTVFVDKRQYVFIDIVADIESKNGVMRVLDELREGDFIVMSELLHCLNEPRKVIEPFTRWPILAVEYSSPKFAYMTSYDAQIQKLGCRKIFHINDVFPKGSLSLKQTETYAIWLVLPIGKKEGL